MLLNLVGLIHALVEASDIFIRVSPALNGSLKTGAIVIQDNFGVAMTSRVVFSKPAHAAWARIGPPGANHGPFTAN